MRNLEHRHKGTQDVARWFDFEHLPEGLPRDVSAEFHHMAARVIDNLPDSPELVKALNELLAAKDWAVRAAIAAA
jgi:hypothetical protein